MAPKPPVFRPKNTDEGAKLRESSKSDTIPSPPAASVTAIESVRDIEAVAIEAPAAASAHQTAVVVVGDAVGDAPPDDASDPLVSLADASTVQLSSERAAELEMELLS
jgi:hypothetical protein